MSLENRSVIRFSDLRKRSGEDYGAQISDWILPSLQAKPPLMRTISPEDLLMQAFQSQGRESFGTRLLHLSYTSPIG
jgi:hypothetical protein